MGSVYGSFVLCVRLSPQTRAVYTLSTSFSKNCLANLNCATSDLAATNTPGGYLVQTVYQYAHAYVLLVPLLLLSPKCQADHSGAYGCNCRVPDEPPCRRFVQDHQVICLQYHIQGIGWGMSPELPLFKRKHQPEYHPTGELCNCFLTGGLSVDKKGSCPFCSQLDSVL